MTQEDASAGDSARATTVLEGNRGVSFFLFFVLSLLAISGHLHVHNFCTSGGV